MKSLTEKKVEAVELFTKVFSGSYIKMAPGDADFKIFSSDGSLIAYADVIDANRRIRDRDKTSRLRGCPQMGGRQNN
jgi:hypothetical protein